MQTDVPAQTRDVLVLGAGWAGLAAAVGLVEGGCPVRLLEAAPTPGGRARGVSLRFGAHTAWLDNGQHLLMGAYRETLALAAQVGVGARASAIRRCPLRLQSVDGLKLEAAPLPAPLHLLVALARARRLDTAERIAMVRMLLRLRIAGWRVRPGETVEQLLERLRQPQSLRRRVWEPLALGALNTEAAQACAATFACVLRDTLGSDAGASDFVLATRTLSELLPTPAVDWLQARGARVALRTPVRQLEPTPSGWLVRTEAETIAARAVVLALPSAVAARLLRPLSLPPAAVGIVNALERLAPAPIATVYLAWPVASEVAPPDAVLLDAQPEHGAPGQWLFDRGVQHGLRIAGVVVSAASDDLDRDTLCAQVSAQVTRQLGLPAASYTRAIVDKRATFLCTPERPRLTPDAFASDLRLSGSSWARLMLAGDYAWPDYPATLEAAVRSGRAAARALLAGGGVRTA